MKKSLLVLLLAAIIFVSGCTGTEESAEVVEEGDYVFVDYIGELEDGTVFDTSIGRQPLEFTVGAGQMIAGFDSGVVGMAVGESKIITIPPEEAYGEHKEELIQPVPIEELPESETPYEAGDILYSINGPVPIVSVNDTVAMIDFNHRLAGKTLIFNVTVVSIGEEE